ncbi:hypothetical protein ACTFIV_003629 [Dictyostelium citrinum]
MLDQQKGDSIVIRFDSALIIYDAGFYKYKESIIKEVERQKFICPITKVIIVISHGDRDHKGSFYFILNWLNKNKIEHFVVVDFACTIKNENFRYVISMEEVRSNNGKKFKIDLNPGCFINFHLPDAKEKNKNKRSIVAVLVYGNKEMLVLTGDQYYDTINNILNLYPGYDLKYFQIPHHGSIHNGHDFGNGLIPVSENYFISGTPNNKQNSTINFQKSMINSIRKKSKDSPIYFNQLAFKIFPKSIYKNVFQMAQTNFIEGGDNYDELVYNLFI